MQKGNDLRHHFFKKRVRDHGSSSDRSQRPGFISGQKGNDTHRKSLFCWFYTDAVRCPCHRPALQRIFLPRRPDTRRCPSNGHDQDHKLVLFFKQYRTDDRWGKPYSHLLWWLHHRRCMAGLPHTSGKAKPGQPHGIYQTCDQRFPCTAPVWVHYLWFLWVKGDKSLSTWDSDYRGWYRDHPAGN